MNESAPLPWWRSLNRNQWLTFLGATLAWFFDSQDQQLFNLARDAAMEDLVGGVGRAIVLGPYTTSVFLVGWAVGGLVFGALGDRYGRAKVMAACVFLYSVFTCLSAFSTSFIDFCVYRFLTGLGVGGVFGLAVALIVDSLDDRARTPALGWLQSISTIGSVGAGLIGMTVGVLASRNQLPGGLKDWQAMFLLGGLPALLSVFVLKWVREPQKWVDARKESVRRGVELGSYRRLLQHKKWSRHAWFGLLMCSAGIVGLWGIGNFHPRIVRAIIDAHIAATGSNLDSAAVASEKAFWVSVALLLQNLGGFFGMLVVARIAQRLGRKPAYATGIVLSFGATILAFSCLRSFSDIFWAIPIMGFGQLSVYAVFAIYLPELFPISLRSTGTGFCYNFGRLVAATAPLTISQITARIGGDIEAFRSAGCMVATTLLLGLLSLPFLPETKGQPLPEE